MANVCNLWDALPDDLQDLVLEHGAAMTIQRMWRKREWYMHVHARVWPRVRAHLARVGVWPHLWAYTHARREWRLEPASWLYVDRPCAQLILSEARQGLWGRATGDIPQDRLDQKLCHQCLRWPRGEACSGRDATSFVDGGHAPVAQSTQGRPIGPRTAGR